MNEIRVDAVDVYRQDWFRQSVFDAGIFEQGLVDLGVDDQAIRAFVLEHKENMRIFRAPYFGDHAKFKDPGASAEMKQQEDMDRMDHVLKKLKSMLGGSEYRVLNSIIREIRIRLFWLTSPKTKRSKVIYKDEMTDAVGAGLTMKVFGTGMGITQNVTITYETELETENGDCKSIFVDFPLRISLVGTCRGGVLVAKGLRSEVPEERQREFRMGVCSESDPDSELALQNAEVSEEVFRLSGDLSKSVQTFSRTEEVKTKTNVTAGLSAFDLEAGSKIEVSRTTKVKMTYKLPAGQDYCLKRDKLGSGIWWG